MKKVLYVLGAGLVSLLMGCATTPVALGPVGPSPVGAKNEAPTGGLEVYSKAVRQNDDQNQAGDGLPVWYSYTDYGVYSPDGKLVMFVNNSKGHYSETPKPVVLPPGNYLVKAQARDYLQVEVPVTIERGRTTKVHLDDKWKLPADVPKTDLVTMPDGQPVGWRANSI